MAGCSSRCGFGLMVHDSVADRSGIIGINEKALVELGGIKVWGSRGRVQGSREV